MLTWSPVWTLVLLGGDTITTFGLLVPGVGVGVVAGPCWHAAITTKQKTKETRDRKRFIKPLLCGGFLE